MRSWLVVWVLAAQSVTQRGLSLRTSGTRVFDQHGNHVRLACVNWYGAHMHQMVPNGLGEVSRKEIAELMASQGFNCVRLTFSSEMLEAKAVPHADRDLAKNEDLKGKTPLEVFDAVVLAITEANMMVILNSHVSTAMWCCDLVDGEGLWFTKEYSTEHWLWTIRSMTQRYRGNPAVAGFDLRNEVRSSELGYPTWGGGGDLDWAEVSEQAARIVLKENEEMLVIIGGLMFNMLLCDIPQKPVHVKEGLKGHIMYSSHEYWFTSWSVNMGTLAHCESILAAIVAASAALLLAADLLGRAPPSCAECFSKLFPRSCVERLSELCGCRACPPVCRQCGLLAAALVWLVAVVMWFRGPPGFHDTCSLEGYFSLALVYHGSAVTAVALPCIFACAYEDALAGLLGGLIGDRSAAAKPELNDSSGIEMTPAAGWGGGARDLGTASGQPALLVVEDLGLEEACKAAEAEGRARAGAKVRWSVTTLVFAIAALLALCESRRMAAYETYAAELDARWGFFLDPASDESHQAPILLGEFGTDTNDAWWGNLMRYIKEHDVDFAYWAWNGRKFLDAENPQDDETYGIVEIDSKTVRHQWKLDAIQSLIGRGR